MTSENQTFKGLDLDHLTALFDQEEPRTYTAGEIIFMPEDSSCEKLYLLKQGKVKMFRLTPDGKRLVTRQLLPGSVFGVRGLLGRAMQGNFAEAVEDSSAYVISWEKVMASLKQKPELALSILENVCGRLSFLEERLLRAAYSPVSVRLAYYILANADVQSGVLANITHEEIGNTIGSVRQTVTENLNLMRKRRLLRITPRKIEVLDRRGLEDVIYRSSL